MTTMDGDARYTCRLCRTLLFREHERVLHTNNNNSSDSGSRKQRFRYGRTAHTLTTAPNKDSNSSGGNNTDKDAHDARTDDGDKDDQAAATAAATAAAATAAASRSVTANDEAVVCTSFFLDPDVSPWVSAASRAATAQGEATSPDTIYCPNARCGAKLGTQSWCGLQCSCGVWVTPAFKILARAVDRMPP